MRVRGAFSLVSDCIEVFQYRPSSFFSFSQLLEEEGLKSSAERICTVAF
jgi:hypothetical protein